MAQDEEEVKVRDCDGRFPSPDGDGNGSGPAEPVSYAESRAALGYGLFALLQPGPLDAVQPVTTAAAVLHRAEPSPSPDTETSPTEAFGSPPGVVHLVEEVTVYDEAGGDPANPPGGLGEEPSPPPVAPDDDRGASPPPPGAGDGAGPHRADRDTMHLLEEVSQFDE